jgi:ATP-dependent Clp protease ATP-binding subunit ClpA
MSHMETIVTRAFRTAEDFQHEYVTLEHMLSALLEDEEIIDFIADLNCSPEHIHDDINLYIAEEMNDIVIKENFEKPRKTNTLERVFNRAYTQMIFQGNTELDPTELLISILAEHDSWAAYVCNKHGLTRENAQEYNTLMNNLHTDVDLPDAWQSIADRAERSSSTQSGKTTNLDEFTVNLNKAAADGKIDELIGRGEEIEAVVQTLARRKKNNVILVGDPGVGKTAIAEGLARAIVAGTVPATIENSVIYSLEIGALLAGTKYRGEFEERIQGLLKELETKPNAILFIDEIHMLMGAGQTSGGGADAANMLKPALQSGKLRVVGSTTYEEYRQRFEDDAALTRRFAKVDVPEPTIEQAKSILRQSVNVYEEYHDLTFDDAAVNAAVELSAQYMHDKKLPDKAFDVIDITAARQRILPEESRITHITEQLIRKEVSKIARIPEETLTAVEDKETAPIDIEVRLKERVFGQDNALTTLADAVYISQAGLKHKDKPVGCYLFTGPTGVGKTEATKALSDLLALKLVRFDMSEYQERHTIAKLIGAPPGYTGYGDGKAGSGLLVNELEQNPSCILLLDEVEKAHPDVLNVLLALMDNGMVSGSNGKSVSARNAIVILTSNLGAADSERAVIGFGETENNGAQDDAVKNFFAPEFRNRLDAIVKFGKLDRSNIDNITVKFLNELKAMVEERGFEFSWTPPVVEYLSEHGFDPQMGARPMGRLIADRIKKPLARAMVFGGAQKKIRIRVIKNKIDVGYEVPEIAK